MLLDGVVRGSWQLRQSDAGAALEITRFGRWAAADRAAADGEAARLLAFAAPADRHEVRYA